MRRTIKEKFDRGSEQDLPYFDTTDGGSAFFLLCDRIRLKDDALLLAFMNLHIDSSVCKPLIETEAHLCLKCIMFILCVYIVVCQSLSLCQDV